jgi:hypothetical protein
MAARTLKMAGQHTRGEDAPHRPEDRTMSKKAKTTSEKKTAPKKSRIRVTGGEPAAPEAAATATENEPETKARKKTTLKDGKMSGLDAAAKILADAGQPLNAKKILERIQAAGLWTTNGKTPQATLYAAIIREIAAKGKDSRFTKTERGRFATA